VSKSALITGITGQDGSYLSELLLSKGYHVHGLVRRSSSFNTARINHIYEDPHEDTPRLILHYGDLTDSTGLRRVIEAALPDEIYNLGAQSHVKVSFENPEYTADADAMGTLRLLDCLRDHVQHTGREIRFYQAGSSEMFGAARPPQNERTPFYPRSPYGAAKLYGYWITVNYREAYGMHASNGILFNHESPIRGETFVTRKITRAVAGVHLGRQGRLYLGNLDAQRDWGHARDYAEGMWLMLQQDQPDDYVLATGETHSVRRFVEMAFAEIGVTVAWQGSGADEKGLDAASGRVLVEIDPRYFRPTEVDLLIGDARKANEKLGWKPKVKLDALVAEMVKQDLSNVARERRRSAD